MRKLGFLVLILQLSAAGAALAQTSTGRNGLVDPSTPPVPDRGSDAPTGSVIKPNDPDPGITVPPPATENTTVVPPPGTPGNAPRLIPK